MKKWNVNWQVKDKIRRIAALLLSFVLLFDALEISAPALIVRAMEESFGAFCTVTKFAELPQELREQTLPVGSQESEIDFPKSLEVTANVLEKIPDGAVQAQDILSSGAAWLPEGETEEPIEEEVIVEDETEAKAEQQPAPVVETDPFGVSLTVDNVEEVPYEQNTVTLDGVKWRIDKEHSDADTFLSDEEHEGAVYTYIAVLPEKDSKGNTILLQDTAKLPEICVTVRGRKNENEEDAGAESESGTEEITETESETETEEITEAETETETEKVTETESETETGKITETETESETGIEELTEAERETETITEHMTETDAEKETGSDKAVEQETEDEKFTETETEERTEAETETELASEEAETETEEFTEAETETEIETEIESESETESETELESETETEVESESETEEDLADMMSLGAGVPMTIAEGDGTEGLVDLKKYVTSVVFEWRDKEGNPWVIKPNEDGVYEFPVDHTLGFNLEYEIPAGIVTRENNVMTYTLPPVFNYAKQSGDITWGDQIVGQYTIDGCNVTLTLDPKSTFFDNDNAFRGYVTFDSTVEEEYVNQNGSFEFKEDVEYCYTFTKKTEEEEKEIDSDNNFDVAKIAAWLDDENNMSYTLTVTPKKNDANATRVEFTDELYVQVDRQEQEGSIQTDSFNYKDIAVKDKNNKELEPLGSLPLELHYAWSTTVKTDEDGREITTVTYWKDGTQTDKVCERVITETNDGNTSTTFTPADGYYMVESEGSKYRFWLPDMEQGDLYTVTYTADLATKLKELGYDINWVKLSLGNWVKGVSEDQKANVWTEHKNNWISKKATGVKKNEAGKYEVSWEIEINPEHLNLPLDAVFSDAMDLPAGAIGTNSNPSITVTNTDNVQNVISSVTDDMLNGLLTGKKTIRQILNELGYEQAADASTTNYSIKISYTTTVDSLPNGDSKAKNTAELEENGKGKSSSEAWADFQNTLLKKDVVESGVKLGEATYAGYEGDTTVFEIPWKVTLKMDTNYADTSASIVDTFGKKLWVTPAALQTYNLKKNLKITVEGEGELASTGYVLSYTEDGTNYKLASEIDENTRITGFKVTFPEGEAYNAVAGKNLILEYTLFGDTDFLDDELVDGNQPSWTYINKVNYAGIETSAPYEKKGDRFVKGYAGDGWLNTNDPCKTWYAHQDNPLPNGRIHWRIETEISDYTLAQIEDDGITIVDRLPGSLNLYSVLLQRHYNSAECGTTELLTDCKPGLHVLKFTERLDWQTTADTEITVTISEVNGDTIIEVTIPKSLILMQDNKNQFNLDIEATIPEDSDLLNPAKYNDTKETFRNTAELEIGGTRKGTAAHEVTVTKQKSGDMVKDGTYIESGSNRIMHYELLANPSGAKRTSGNPLTLVDTLEYDTDVVSSNGVQLEAYVINLVPGSVKAYYYDTNGEKVYLPAPGKSFSYKYEETVTSPTTQTQSGKKLNKLTMEIPDETAVYIEYDYALQANKDFDWVITNKATLYGEGSWQDEDKETVGYQRSSAGVEKGTVNFYKVDQDNYNITLPDAVFSLSVWDETAAEGEGAWVPDLSSEDLRYFVSGGDGKIPVDRLRSNQLYWLKEKTPPVGYQKVDPDNPESKDLPADDAGYYFYLVDQENAKEPAKPKDFKHTIHALSGVNNTVYIPNRLVGSGTIAARKIWTDGTPRENVSLTLYQGDAQGYTYEDTKGDNPSLKKVENDQNGNHLTNPAEIVSGAAELTVQWDNLPTEDSDGKPIYYYVFETQAGSDMDPKSLDDGSYIIDGYNVRYGNDFGLRAGTVTITNSRGSIAAKKIWEKDTDRSDVTFKLYRSTKNDLTAEQIQQYFESDPSIVDESTDPCLEPAKDMSGAELGSQTISASASDNDLTVQWSNLPVVDEASHKLYYYVFETNAGVDGTMQFFDGKYQVGEYEVSYAGNGVTNGTVTVTNKGRNATDIKVVKKWLDASGKEKDIATNDANWQVTLELYQKLADGSWTKYSGSDGTVTLPENGKWEHIWTELPKGEYYVKEVNGKERFDTYYKKDVSGEFTLNPDEDKEPENASVTKGTITVINKEQTTEIEVEKIWVDEAGNLATPKADSYVTMQLYRSTTPPAQEPETINTSITVSVSDWQLLDGTTRVGAPSSGEITVDIYECDESGTKKDGGLVRTVILNSGTEWRATVNDLPGVTINSDRSTTEYFYAAEVASHAGIDSAEIKSPIVLAGRGASHTVELVATYTKAEPKKKKIELFVDVGYEKSSSAEISTNSAIVRIMCNSSDDAEAAYKSGIMLNVENKLVKCVSLGAGKYQKTQWEIYDCVSFEISNLQAVTEEYIKITCNAKGMSGVWDYANVIEEVPDTSISYTASSGYRLMNNPGSAGSTVNFPPDSDLKAVEAPVTLNSENEWSKKWLDLPQYDSAGNKLYYYVKEAKMSPDVVRTDYHYDYIDQAEPWKGIKKVTVTNILPNKPDNVPTTVSVEKKWDGGYTDDEVKDYNVEVKLQYHTRSVANGSESNWPLEWKDYTGGTVTLTYGTDNWTHIWSDLPWKEYSDTNNYTEYEYNVQEVRVYKKPDSGTSGGEEQINNFTSATSGGSQGDGSYSFTITNTKKRQGITLPGTGSKYPWIFYGIGMTFMLIALVWIRRALKKSYIPSDTGKGGRRSDE